jgi:hypothetical protein
MRRIWLVLVVFALGCGDPDERWLFGSGSSSSSGSGNPLEISEEIHAASTASSEGAGDGSAPPLSVQLSGVCEQEGGCACYEYEGDPIPNDSWCCNPETGIARECWEPEGAMLVAHPVQQFCTGKGWDCGYEFGGEEEMPGLEGGQPGCWKNSKAAGSKRFTKDVETYSECFNSGYCPGGTEILSCFEGPRFWPWTGAFHLFCGPTNTCGTFWLEINGNAYCICDQQGVPDECRSCEEGLAEVIPDDPCAEYAPVEEDPFSDCAPNCSPFANSYD